MTYHFDDTKWRSGPLSLGITQLELMGYPDSGKCTQGGGNVIISNSFVTGCYQSSEVVAILPDPDGDTYLGAMGIQTLMHGECALVLPLISGLGEYYVSRGIVDSINQIIEVNRGDFGGYVIGYPDNDPLAALWRNGKNSRAGCGMLGEPSVYLTAFPNPESKFHAHVLGFQHPQPGYASLVNNKALFRKLARKYAIPIPNGCALSSESDILIALDILGSSKNGWMKLDRGSGGDLVVKLQAPVTNEQVKGAVRALRGAFQRALMNNRWNDVAAREYWPENSFFPAMGTITIEEDIRPAEIDAGCVFMNSHDGSYSVPAFFQKLMTGGGQYIGGLSYYPTQGVLDLLQEYLPRFGKMFAEEFGFYGFAGLDFIVSRGLDGSPRITFYEFNGRMPISGIAYLLARKLGYRYWNNTNLTFPGPLRSFGDIEDVIGDLLSTRFNRIIPQALRTSIRIEIDGQRQVLVPSARGKFFIGGDSPEDCQRMLQHLLDRGVEVG